MLKQRLLFVLLTSLLLVSTSEATIRWVDGNNTTPPWYGTQADPFMHPGQIFDSLTIGDTVRVLDGTYIIYPDSVGRNLHFLLPNSDINSPQTVFQAYLPNAGDTVFLRVADDRAGYGIWVDSTAWNLLIENFIILRALTGDSTIGHAAGIRLSGHNTLVRNNRLYKNNMGIFVTPPSEEEWYNGNKIYGNIISNSTEAGLRVKGTHWNRIFANLLYDNDRGHDGSAALTIYRADSVYVWNNTIVTDSVAPAISLNRAGAPADSVSYCHIFDNICVTMDDEDTPVFKIDSCATTTLVTTNRCDHNTWWDYNGTTYFDWSGTNMTFARFEDSLIAHNWGCEGERNRDPLIDTTRTDSFCFELRSTSNEIDKGSRTAAQADMDRLTAIVTQSTDVDTVERGMHQIPHTPTMNLAWTDAEDYESTAVPGGLSLPTLAGGGDDKFLMVPLSALQIKQAILYNILGQQVAILKSSEIGRLVAEVYTLNLPNGFYLLKMDTNAGLKVMKLPLMR